MRTKKIAIAITGASGAIYARNLIQLLTQIDNMTLELGIVWSNNAKDVWRSELDEAPAFDTIQTWSNNDFFAPIASGSARWDALVICPCSMGTLGRIAHGISDTLITRAADVMLKERKQLICVVRETPYNTIHLQNMLRISEAGGIICPASPSFYSKPDNMEALVETVTSRVLHLLDIDTTHFQWGLTQKP